MDIVTLALAKNYTNKKIAEIASGFVYKGAVNYRADLDNIAAEIGHIYTVKYKGTSGTDPWNAEFVYGNYEGTNTWIELGSDYSAEINELKNNKLDKPVEPVAGQGLNVPYYFDVKYNESDAIVTDYTVDLLDKTKAPKQFQMRITSASAQQAGLLQAGDKFKLDTLNQVEANPEVKSGETPISLTGLQIGENKYKIEAGSGEPEAYIKNAAISTNGHSLTLTKKDNTTVTFTPGAFSPFPTGENGFVTNKTTKEFGQSVVSHPSFKAGMAWYGELWCSDLPNGLINIECTVKAMTDTIAVIELSSSNREPYHWEYNTDSFHQDKHADWKLVPCIMQSKCPTETNVNYDLVVSKNSNDGVETSTVKSLTAGNSIIIDDNRKINALIPSFRGTWDTWNAVPTDSSLYPVDHLGNKIPNLNDYLVIKDASAYEYTETTISTINYVITKNDSSYVFTLTYPDSTTSSVTHVNTDVGRPIIKYLGKNNEFEITAIGNTQHEIRCVYDTVYNGVTYTAGSLIVTTQGYYSTFNANIAASVPTTVTKHCDGTWRFKYKGVWSTDGKNGWKHEYQIHEVSSSNIESITVGGEKLTPFEKDIKIVLGNSLAYSDQEPGLAYKNLHVNFKSTHGLEVDGTNGLKVKINQASGTLALDANGLKVADNKFVELPNEPVIGQGINVPYYFDVNYSADKATVKDYTIDLLNKSKAPQQFSIDINSATQATAGLMSASDKKAVDEMLPAYPTDTDAEYVLALKYVDGVWVKYWKETINKSDIVGTGMADYMVLKR